MQAVMPVFVSDPVKCTHLHIIVTLIMWTSGQRGMVSPLKQTNLGSSVNGNHIV